jgi:hypothetical protein
LCAGTTRDRTISQKRALSGGSPVPEDRDDVAFKEESR